LSTVFHDQFAGLVMHDMWLLMHETFIYNLLFCVLFSSVSMEYPVKMAKKCTKIFWFFFVHIISRTHSRMYELSYWIVFNTVLQKVGTYL